MSSVSVPLRQRIFDMVESGVHENAHIIPSTRLDSDGLVNEAALGKGFAGQGDRYRPG
jgi:hypothetical protein